MRVLFDEVAKLWQCYESKKVFELLQHYELFKYLFPLTVKSLKTNPHAQAFIENAFENTDVRMREQNPPHSAFLLRFYCGIHARLRSGID